MALITLSTFAERGRWKFALSVGLLNIIEYMDMSQHFSLGIQRASVVVQVNAVTKLDAGLLEFGDDG